MSEVAVEVRDLAKTFYLGFFRQKVEAVKGIDFEVKQGEIFGLVGPNGAGKTTTLKMLMGLIQPTRGSAKILGQPIPLVQSRRWIGYLPEISYYYDYLNARELLNFYGQLYGLSPQKLKTRIDMLIEQVGLSHAAQRPLRKFSKGMLQRIGLAQAMISDPKILFLDEPQSGLDPIGRKEVTDIILSLKAAGKTVIFSSHILSDVERICDRVAILIKGRLVDYGPLDQLLNPKIMAIEVVLGGLEGMDKDAIEVLAQKFEAEVILHAQGQTWKIAQADRLQALIKALVEMGIEIQKVTPQYESLEDVFVREAQRVQHMEEQR